MDKIAIAELKRQLQEVGTSLTPDAIQQLEAAGENAFLITTIKDKLRAGRLQCNDDLIRRLHEARETEFLTLYYACTYDTWLAKNADPNVKDVGDCGPDPAGVKNHPEFAGVDERIAAADAQPNA